MTGMSFVNIKTKNSSTEKLTQQMRVIKSVNVLSINLTYLTYRLHQFNKYNLLISYKFITEQLRALRQFASVKNIRNKLCKK